MNKAAVSRISRYVLVIAFVVALFFSWRVTGLNLARLVRDLPKGAGIFKAFLTPDLTTRAFTTQTVGIAFPIPCGSADNDQPPASGPRLVPTVACADPRTKFTLNGYEMTPNSEIVVRWVFPDDRKLTAVRTRTDAAGDFSAQLEARPIAASVEGKAAELQVDTLTSVGGLMPSQALKDVLQNMFVTVFMALLSTSVATVIAAPLSFLAAGNITRKGCLGGGVYYVTRSAFNITRSYDPLVMATVFGFWLGFGPLAGVLALTIVTIASLGKLFSEAVENIDSGPIEAVQATGANRLQSVVYAVIPQIVPDFVSYIIYHWDINVRISTIIGFVAGAGSGIGYYLSQRINGFEYNKAGTAIWAIVIVVWALDFLSAEVRKKLT